MANKPVAKVPIDKEKFMALLKTKGLSIRKLGKMPGFNYTDRSIERALQSGFMSYGLAYSLSLFLGAPVKSFEKRN